MSTRSWNSAFEALQRLPATLRVKCKLLSWWNPSHTLAASASIISLLSIPHPHPEHSTLVQTSGPLLGWPALSPDSPHLSGHSLSATPLSCPRPSTLQHLSLLYTLHCIYPMLSCHVFAYLSVVLFFPHWSVEHEQGPQGTCAPDPWGPSDTWSIVGVS